MILLKRKKRGALEVNISKIITKKFTNKHYEHITDFVIDLRLILKSLINPKNIFTFNEIIQQINDKYNNYSNYQEITSILKDLSIYNYDTKNIYPLDLKSVKSKMSEFILKIINHKELKELIDIYTILDKHFKQQEDKTENNSFIYKNFENYIDFENVLKVENHHKSIIKDVYLDLMSLKYKPKKIVDVFLEMGVSSKAVYDIIHELEIVKVNKSKLKILDEINEITTQNRKKIDLFFSKYLNHGLNHYQIISLLQKKGWSKKFIDQSLKNLKIETTNIYTEDFDNKIIEYSKLIKDLKKEIKKIIVGQDVIVRSFILAIMSNGHVLIEGPPGLAKTTLIHSLSYALSCNFKRIQFTADLLPSDIIGFQTYIPNKGSSVVKGPVFTNILLADEINRACAKVQSALLECMEEKQVSIAKETFKLDLPFFVFATQNPIETLGTYPLPQAQLDRFLFKLNISYPSVNDEMIIVDNNKGIKKMSEFNIKSVMGADKIIEIQEFVKQIYISPILKEYCVKIIDATRNYQKYNLVLGEFLEWGAGPRATISLILSAKANALYNLRSYVIDQDIKDVIFDVFNHRILLNYEGQAKNIEPSHIVKEILSIIPAP